MSANSKENGPVLDIEEIDKKKVKELIQICKDFNIERFNGKPRYRLRKSELIEAIKNGVEILNRRCEKVSDVSFFASSRKEYRKYGKYYKKFDDINTIVEKEIRIFLCEKNVNLSLLDFIIVNVYEIAGQNFVAAFLKLGINEDNVYAKCYPINLSFKILGNETFLDTTKETFPAKHITKKSTEIVEKIPSTEEDKVRKDFTFLIKKEARNAIKSFSVQSPYIDRWLVCDESVKCYILYENDIAKSFIILSKMDYDPIGDHINPYMLDFIYTFPQYRREGYAYRLLAHIKTREELSVYTDNDDSNNLFKKADFVEIYPNFFVYPKNIYVPPLEYNERIRGSQNTLSEFLYGQGYRNFAREIGLA